MGVNMEIKETKIPGLLHIVRTPFHDERGTFVNLYREPKEFCIDFKESFYSISKKGVIRGMHFATPPYAHDKLVTLISGKIVDAVIDLRPDSPTYKKYCIFDLYTSESLYVPIGCAHGFRSIADNSVVLYSTSLAYRNGHDEGIRWDSFGFDWGSANKIVSKRDQQHPTLDEFVKNNPFGGVK
jgi:dTDP-4-dehydrorhamnose 3,5-epimerase